MIGFAICDDIEWERTEIREALDDYLCNHSEIQAEVTEFSSAIELEDSIESGNIPNILLLDIYMPSMNGISLARKIRNQNLSTKIIFITSSRDYAVEAFQLEATHYLVKPFSKSDLSVALDRVINSFKTESKKISINCGSGIISFVNLDDIIYIESQGYKRYIYTKKETLIESKRNLTQFIELLNELSPGRFFSPYRGYIINMDEVCSITSKYIEMQGGSHVLIKTGDFAKIKKIYFDYSFSHGMGGGMENE